MKNWKVALIIIAASAAGIIGINRAASNIINDYGVSYYQDKFMPGTVINGIDCTYMTTAQVKEALQERVDSFRLEIPAGCESLQRDPNVIKYRTAL